MINHEEVITEQFHEIEELRTDLNCARIALVSIREICKSPNFTADFKVAEALAESMHSLSLLTTKPTWSD